MQTPWISFTQTPQTLSYYDRAGHSRSLEIAQDGKLEKELCTGMPDRFVSDLADARLHGEKAGAGSLGPGWTYTYSGGEKIRLGSPEGNHQLVEFHSRADGSRDITLTTVSNGVEHLMTGHSQAGNLEPESVKEKARLDVSPAGLDVYCDGKVLFEMPSAFGGGCTW